MNRQGKIRRPGGWVWRLALPLGVAVAAAFGPSHVLAQGAAPLTLEATAPPIAGPSAPGTAVVEAEGGAPLLPPDVQVVRLQVPEGVHVEVLGPSPEPVPVAVASGQATGLLGLKVGVGYRLRVWDLPGRPGAELYPVVELVGHLHRPNGLDLAKFPVRLIVGEDDFVDAVDRGRLVTKVVYLEDPEQALPISLPKGEIPIVTLSPVEDPLKVGAALGRVMAVVRIGGRRPTVDELSGAGIAGVGLDGMPARCPFTGPSGGPCRLPCGPVRGTAPPPGRPWVPRDEYLCDGGDHAEVAHFGGDGGLLGIDPRDAVIRFSDDRRPRVLPTNLVCIYAPRFAEVRASVGPNQAMAVLVPRGAEMIEAQADLAARQRSNRLVQNQAAEANRERVRPSAMAGRVFAGVHAELRVLNGFDVMTHLAGHTKVERAEVARDRRKAAGFREKVPPLTIKTAEGAVVTAIVQGAGQMVMTWPAREVVGVEVPPNKPGLAVIKRVSASEAEPGDEVSFVIQFRNMGNTPIRAVSVIDSLLPRLGYVAGSAQGPRGTIFTAGENRAGSTELRWDLPGVLAPGAEGSVSFRAVVR